MELRPEITLNLSSCTFREYYKKSLKGHNRYEQSDLVVLDS